MTAPAASQEGDMKAKTIAWGLAALVLSAGARAEGVALLKQSDYLPASQEGTLTSAQAGHLADRRKYSVRSDVVTLNPAALESGVITIYLRGKTHEYVGPGKVVLPPAREDWGWWPGVFTMHQFSSWNGKGTGLNDSANLLIEKGVVYGEVTQDGVVHHITHAGGDRYVLSVWPPPPPYPRCDSPLC
jgi:hypothetical protein